MTTIHGESLLTITAEAGEIYEIDYKADHTVCILNHTDDVIAVSDRPSYYDDGTSANCIKIAANAFFNNLTIHGRYLYITPAEGGNITLVRAA